MDFSLTPEQQLLSETVQRFLAQRYGFEARRKIVRSAEGWSREIWGQLAEMGLLGLQIPEAQGGMAPAAVETMLVMNAFGRVLLVEPYLSSAVLATALLRQLGSRGQQEALFPSLAAGERIAVPAHGEEGARYDLAAVSTAAARRGGGWVLSGKKSVVLHAPAADLLLVSARTSGPADAEQGISLFLVPRGAPGVAISPYSTLDGQRAAEVALREVVLPADALLGPEGGAFGAIAAAWDLGLAALCAEGAGALQATLDATIDYAKTRRQFGQPIAKFQALQHRMVDMLVHVEQARSMSTLAALRAFDPDPAERRRAVAAAKVTVGQACRFVGQQAVQLHGGMGVTDEVMVSHLFKRLAAIELSMGDTEHHLEAFARTLGGKASP
jgi:alkylation response protein AidB-like acyl-CoA dehydrogenase